MSLESELQSLNANLSKLIEILAAGTPEKKPKARSGGAGGAGGAGSSAPDSEAEKPKEPTAEDHQKMAEPVIQELLNKGKKAQILELNKKFGVEKGRQLYGTDKFAAYLEEAKKLNAA